MGNIISPCVGVCKLNSNRICVGCNRTIDEIASWINYTDAKKIEILNLIKDRKNETL